MICPYCKNEAPWVENQAIYGRNFGKSYMCYYCKPCNAYVGCHNNTRKPLGTMANKELRDWRIKAHAVFDLLWKNEIKSKGFSKKIRREKAYGLLEGNFGFKVHIAESDVEMCKKIIEFIKVKE